MVISELNTQRLALEPFADRHSSGMFALWSSPEVCRFSGPAADLHGRAIQLPAKSPADSDRILEFFMVLQQRGHAVRWAMTLRDGTFVGAVGYNALGPCCELAFHQLPAYWGQGFMTEACRAVIDWVFAGAGAGVDAIEIDAFVEARNTASMRLLTRLGFVATHAARDGAQRYLLDAPTGSAMLRGTNRGQS